MRLHIEKTKKHWQEEAESIAIRLNSEPDCHWIVITLRAECALTAATRAATEKALDLTVSQVQREVNQELHLNKRRLLRFFPCIGGEPDKDLLPHIHALIELPPGIERQRMECLLRRFWRYFLKKRHGFPVEADVWMDEEHDAHLPTAVRYFVRPEGLTYSNGSEKVMWECVRLTPSV